MAGQPVMFAATDIGSNATKVAVWEIGGDRPPRERFQQRFPLRLDDAFRAGRIEPPKVARLVEAFTEIARICRRYHVARVRAVATDAFRTAANRREVAEAVELESGIAIEVLSPEEEGRLVAEGVLLDNAAGGDPFLIIDVGGGSAELIMVGSDGARSFYLPLGAVRLREAFIRSDPIAPADFEAMRAHVEETVARRLVRREGAWSKCGVGCGGGVRFLHTMCGVLRSSLSQDEPLRVDQLEHLGEVIWPMRTDSLVQRYGIDPERAEIIIPGAVVLVALMKRLGLAALQPSARGVRDGLLADFVRCLQ